MHLATRVGEKIEAQVQEKRKHDATAATSVLQHHTSTTAAATGYCPKLEEHPDESAKYREHATYTNTITIKRSCHEA